MNFRLRMAVCAAALLALGAAPLLAQKHKKAAEPKSDTPNYPINDGFVDVNGSSQGYVDAEGMLIYYMTVGRGEPLVIVHGGPGDRTITFCLICCPWRGRTSWFLLMNAGRGNRRS